MVLVHLHVACAWLSSVPEVANRGLGQACVTGISWQSKVRPFLPRGEKKGVGGSAPFCELED